MKVLAVLVATHCLLACSALSVQQLKGMMKMPRSMCMQKTGASKEHVQKIQSGEFVDDPKLKCYIKCCMGLMGMLKDGHYDVATTRTQMQKMLPEDWKEPMMAVIDTCASRAGQEDACEDAYQILKCNWETDSKVFLFP